MKMLMNPSFTVAAGASARAQANQPPPPGASVSLTTVRHIMAVYNRHFAGQPRGTRDPDHLAELVARVEDQRARVASLPGVPPVLLVPHLAVMGGHLTLMSFEQLQLRHCGEGNPAEDRAAWLATRINDVVATYRAHFEGHPRLSRRVGLLRRLATSVQRIELELCAPELANSGAADHVRANLDLVGRLARHFELEAEAIAAEQATADPEARVSAWMGAIRVEVDTFVNQLAHKERRDWELPVLSGICDRLGEIEHQLVDATAVAGDEVADRTLRTVQTHLDAYEIVWEEVIDQRRRALG